MKKIGKIFFAFFLILIIPILIINLTIIIKGKINPNKIPDFMGYKPFVVLSGSMETKIKIGDLVIVKDTDYREIKENDIIAFRQDNVVITHRVVNVNNDNGKISFKTKGDNNNVQDDFIVKSSDLEGKYVLRVAKLGNYFMFLSKPLGMIVIFFGIIIISGIFYFTTFTETEEDKKLRKEFEEFKRNKTNN